MFFTALAALLSCPLLMLRIKSAGSFPRALTADEEAEYLARAAQGDDGARSKLIEHNLRLVAHIVKKGYPSRKLFLAGNGQNEV